MSPSEQNRKKRRAEGRERSSSDHDAKKLAGAKAVILRALGKYDKEFWDSLPLDWKSDREVAMAALKHGKTKVGELRADLKNDRDFLIAAASENSTVWYSLPPALRNDVNFARSLTSYTDEEFVFDILGKFPDLANERNVWMAIFNEPEKPNVSYYDLVGAHAPPVILSDQELMIKACALDGDILVDHVDDTLSRNRDFLRDLLTLKPSVLRHIPDATQRMFQNIVIEFLPKALQEIFRTSKESLPQQSCRWLAESIPDDLWRDRNVVRTWFQSGGPFLPNPSMESLNGDREVFLWIAKFSPEDDRYGVVGSFNYASAAICSDKAFMLEAIQLNPNIFHAAHEDLRNDFDVFLTAFGGTPGKHPYITSDTWRRLRRGGIAEFVPRIEVELQKHETFVKTLLCGMSQHAGDASSTSLALLNQGETTSLSYKRLIAAYLDVPTGKRLGMLHNASRILLSVLTVVAQI